jgi:galactokinase
VPNEVTAFAPGRVNLIGEHTDYNAGLALPFAIGQGVTVRAVGLQEPRIEAWARDRDSRDGFGLDQVRPARGWRAFARGAVAELQRLGVPVGGARVEITGTVPPGAGLSSSAALEVALTKALIALSGGPELDRIELARLGSRIENTWVGTQSGLLDQLASLYGQAGHVLRIDFRSLDIQPIGLELGQHRLVTLDSGERHAHAVSGYNQRRAECAEACRLLGVSALRDVAPARVAELPEPLNRRARHVLSSNARVDAAVAALGDRDLAEVGRLIDAEHASLRDDYEVSTPAVEAAVRRLMRAGALGARIIGGGFGGHVLGLLPPGAPAPEGAIEVEPSAGAHIVHTA